jgi:hypothetical protein
MFSRFTALVPFVLLAFAPLPDAVAQDGSSDDGAIILRGWSLPEGTVITSTTHLRRNAELNYFAPGQDAEDGEPLRTLEVYTLRSDSLRTRIVEVDGHGPRAIEQHILISDILEDVHEGNEILERGRRPMPLSGTIIAAQRDGHAWHRQITNPAEPRPEQLEALQARFSLETPQYPDRPIHVGESWEVDREGLAMLHGELVAGATQRMTLQLDSTSTFLGQPAAYISYGLDVTVDRGDGLIMRINEVGVVVRLIDRFVDVMTQWQGTFRTEREGVFEDGEPYVAVMEGSTRGQSQQFLMVPHTASP